MSRPRILMAMSGGVDSSVAAALLVEAGFEVVGATMKTFCYSETEGSSKTCCGLDGILDAKRVADTLGIPHYVFDVEEEFTRDVIDDFVHEYSNGRTPNPCVRCNSNTKFKDLFRRGEALGCEGVGSGHYVRSLHPEAGESSLYRGLDRRKDQSYFLWGLPREMLSLLHFPLGGLTKNQVRAKARELGLVTADKPESQEICFVPTGDYRDLLRRRLPSDHPALEPGPIVTSSGEVLGEHGGYGGFTIGQRRGLGGGSPEPLYVLAIRPEERAVVVGSLEELNAHGVTIGELNWLTTPVEPGQEVTVQLRYRAPVTPALVKARTAIASPVADSSDRLTLELLEPQKAVTPGQSAVIFRDDRVLGGGRIVRSLADSEVAGSELDAVNV